jgi:hypothetical protein
MAKYTATKFVTVYDSVEEAVAGLETTLETIDTGQNHLTFDIVRIEGNKYATWVVYTTEA